MPPSCVKFIILTMRVWGTAFPWTPFIIVYLVAIMMTIMRRKTTGIVTANIIENLQSVLSSDSTYLHN